MDAKALVEWPDIVFQAVGFASQAATLGALGLGLGAIALAASLHKRALSKSLTFEQAALAQGSALKLQVALLLVLLAAFVLARRRVAIGWPLAALAVLAYALRGLAGGHLATMINPLHVLGASLWIGTLFVLVVCGLRSMLSSAVPPDEREEAVADMVHRFSTLALLAAALLGATGLWTAWTHLKRIDALWTTPYGMTLDLKLAVVLVVLGLGAWNWRKVGPALGSEGGAETIRRTATTELVFAGVVLAVTAVLVSIPSPK
jgi:copper transport protein